MYCNVAAEATEGTLAVRLFNSTSDPGMQEMLGCLIARDMHQQQWLADRGARRQCSSTDSQQLRSQQGSCGIQPHVRSRPGRYCEGASLDGQGVFESRRSSH
jgi:Mn-containing catalase